MPNQAKNQPRDDKGRFTSSLSTINKLIPVQRKTKQQTSTVGVRG